MNIVWPLIIISTFPVFAIASPTENEYIPCNKKAVAILEYCLKDKEDKCWQKSKASYQICRQKVIASHSVDVEKMADKLKLIEQSNMDNKK